MTDTRAVTLNALALYALSLLLTAAFAAQLMLRELPCRCVCCSASFSRCWRSGRS